MSDIHDKHDHNQLEDLGLEYVQSLNENAIAIDRTIDVVLVGVTHTTVIVVEVKPGNQKQVWVVDSKEFDTFVDKQTSKDK